MEEYEIAIEIRLENDTDFISIVQCMIIKISAFEANQYTKLTS